ncbi:MAG: isopenicillin N synthase family oxygenase, partial [Proteobacteria bacterium]
MSSNSAIPQGPALVIPTVDLADIDSGDASRRERATKALREAFGIYGLAYVKGHSVDP